MEQNTAEKRKTKARPGLVIFAILLFLAGAAIFLYPTISNYLAEVHQVQGHSIL